MGADRFAGPSIGLELTFDHFAGSLNDGSGGRSILSFCSTARYDAGMGHVLAGVGYVRDFTGLEEGANAFGLRLGAGISFAPNRPVDPGVYVDVLVMSETAGRPLNGQSPQEVERGWAIGHLLAGFIIYVQ